MLVAIARAAAGDEEGSLASLDDALARSDPMVVLQIRDPRLSTIHDDPRWSDALTKLRL